MAMPSSAYYLPIAAGEDVAISHDIGLTAVLLFMSLHHCLADFYYQL